MDLSSRTDTRSKKKKVKSNLYRDDAARFVVVRFVGVILVQWVELRVGLVAESFVPHRAEVKMEAVQQEVNFDPSSPGLRTDRWGRTQDEGGAVDCAARLILGVNTETRK